MLKDKSEKVWFKSVKKCNEIELLSLPADLNASQM